MLLLALTLLLASIAIPLLWTMAETYGEETGWLKREAAYEEAEPGECPVSGWSV